MNRPAITFIDYNPETRSYQRITLSPSAPRFSVETSEPHDEGYCHAFVEWELKLTEGRVEKTTQTDSRDCDGRHKTYRLESCALSDLRTQKNGGHLTPAWAKTNAHQRDYFAEAAGW